MRWVGAGRFKSTQRRVIFVKIMMTFSLFGIFYYSIFNKKRRTIFCYKFIRNYKYDRFNKTDCSN